MNSSRQLARAARIRFFGCRLVTSAALTGAFVFSAVVPAFGQADLFTDTEVVAAIRSTNWRADLAAALGGPGRSLVGLINVEASQDLLTLGQTKIVEIPLRRGADPRNVVQLLQSLPFVEWASPNLVYDVQTYGDPRELDPDDPRYPDQYHHRLMQNNLAWDMTLGSAHVTVAVTDDGVEIGHQDLALNIWINQREIPASRRPNLVDIDEDQLITFVDLNDPVNQGEFKITDINGNGRIDAGDTLRPMDVDGNGNDLGSGGWANLIDEDDNTYADDLHGWDFSSMPNDNDPNPVGGAAHGTHVSGIVAARTNNNLGVAGTAGHAAVMPIRFYGSSPWTSTVIARSYAYAVNNGAQIINTSYNVDGFSNDPTYRAALQYVYEQGGIHFNSGGNNNQLNPLRQKLDWSLFVVSTDAADRKSGFSNYGFGMDISAPGSAILSTLRNNTYGFLSGTSMAAPNAAAAAALIWSSNRDWTREQVLALLMGTADSIDELQLPQHSGLVGSGRANSFRGVASSLAPPRFKRVLDLPDEGGSISALSSFRIDVANVFDPPTINDIANWELRSDGLDDIFDTEDDGLIALELTTELGVGYLIGTNRLIFRASEVTPERYRFRAISGGLMDPFGSPLDGNDDGIGGDHFERVFSVEGNE